MIYLFTYELHHGLLRNSIALEQEIGTFPGWFHCTEKVWLIASNDDINAVNERLARHLTQTDYWLIVRITQEYQGWLPQEAWEWLRQSISAVGI